MDDITQLEHFEEDLKVLYEKLTAAEQEKTNAEMDFINHKNKVKAIQNLLDQKKGARDSLKKILNSKPQ